MLSMNSFVIPAFPPIAFSANCPSASCNVCIFHSIDMTFSAILLPLKWVGPAKFQANRKMWPHFKTSVEILGLINVLNGFYPHHCWRKHTSIFSFFFFLRNSINWKQMIIAHHNRLVCICIKCMGGQQFSHIWLTLVTFPVLQLAGLTFLASVQLVIC